MKKIMFCLAVMMIWGGAQAQQLRGGYMSLGFGSSNVRMDCPASLECDKSDSGPRVSVGLNLNAVAALEAIYVHFGRMNIDIANGTGTVKGSAYALGANLALRHQFIPEFGGVLRLGVMRVTEKVRGEVPAANFFYEESGDATKPYWGLGLEYQFTPTLKAFAAADFARGEEGRYELYSLGVQAGF